MSAVTRLEITAFRNIRRAALDPAPGVNYLVGPNGSGKTSLLEALHLLASGRSFRGALVDPLITHDCETAVLRAELADGPAVGLEKFRRGGHRLKLGGAIQRNWDEAARALPVQLIDAGSFQLLDGGPKVRRRFLDWGVFHVEHAFVGDWRNARRCLANRNRLLRRPAPDAGELAAWDRELCRAAARVDAARRAGFERLAPLFEAECDALGAELPAVTLAYRRGWDPERELAAVLERARASDVRLGASQHGPHRADVEIRVAGRRAADVLSRGQQKLLACALRIAQGRMLAAAAGRDCVYLVDDLASELDRGNRRRVLDRLTAREGQLFVTCLDRSLLDPACFAAAGASLFHVEHGRISG